MKKILMLFASVPLVACSTYADDGGDAQPDSAGEETVAENAPSSGGRTYTDEERKFLDSVNFCQEDGLGSYVGAPADEATIAAMMEKSGAKVPRVVGPGEAMTMDYRTDRLTILTDEQGRIAQARCG